MSDDAQGVYPMVAYSDGVAALEWLARAFAFVERVRTVGEDGRLSHGEMSTPYGTVMLASPSPAYEGPRAHREHCDAARAWSAVPWVVDGVLVYVDDVDAHHRRAVEAGAHVLSEPEPGPPGRRYRVEDCEGHRWMFMEHP